MTGEKEGVMAPEEYAKQHQRAFRTAFNFLNSHFPPQNDSEWWLCTARECSEASVAAGEDKLTIELLSGVVDYLQYEYEKRRET